MNDWKPTSIRSSASIASRQRNSSNRPNKKHSLSQPTIKKPTSPPVGEQANGHASSKMVQARFLHQCRIDPRLRRTRPCQWLRQQLGNATFVSARCEKKSSFLGFSSCSSSSLQSSAMSTFRLFGTIFHLARQLQCRHQSEPMSDGGIRANSVSENSFCDRRGRR
ncbi:Hypothetical predicted protein [Olea europaea subsp. europaea]|uniref:Uncharacterized protein n=1 Tax=Olea europaea subsp. europaea TaxID=158383 RepID=A0A8S0VGF4_OLEEU|nr:Hypothetical predicted protein [Olea europaea subsp. europaea]